MFQQEVTITNESGLHARPASIFVKEASKFKSNIKVVKNDKEYNAKSIIGVLSMGAVKGDNILIIAEGEDEEEAIDALINLISENFNE